MSAGQPANSRSTPAEFSVWDELVARGGQPDRVYHIYGLGGASAISNLATGVCAVWLLWGMVPHWLAVIWLGLMVVKAAYFKRSQAPENLPKIRRISPRLVRRLSYTSALFAALWAPVFMLAMVADSVPQIAVVTMVFALMLGVALVYCMIPIAALSYGVTLMAPGVIFSVFAGDTDAHMIALAAVFLLASIMVFCYRYSVMTRASERRSEQRAIALELLERAHDDIQTLAERDATTGLANRRSIIAKLEEQLTGNLGTGATLFLIDLDHFKHINDAYGHDMGDAYLRRMGGLMRDAAGSDATVGRLGGDEFAIITHRDVSLARQKTMGNNLLKALNGFVEIDEVSIRSGATIGAVRAIHAENSAATWLSFADHALRGAKSQQRGTLRFFGGSDKAQMLARNSLGMELATAIANNEITPWYQPKIHLSNGALMGYEVLARWASNSGRDVPPMRFFDLAEQIGLVLDLSELIFRRAAQDVASFAAKTGQRPAIALNIHPVQLHHVARLEAVLREVIEIIEDPEILTLEITENCIIGRGTEEVPAVLRHLARLGCRISLDDFGTGYASLTHIQTLPIDELKIDRKFIRDIARNQTDREIVRSILRIARLRDIEVVAEGVEGPEQIAILRAEGCKIGQGYYFARPMSADAVHDYAERYGKWNLQRLR